VIIPGGGSGWGLTIIRVASLILNTILPVGSQLF
jgi:hypothetical protein